MKLLSRAYELFRAKGLFFSVRRAVKYLFFHAKSKFLKSRILVGLDSEDIFTKIFKSNLWGSDESVSGYGSTLHYTERLRKDLPSMFERFAIESIFDAPCGDFNWMQHVIQEPPKAKYLGGDIVEELVETNSRAFNSETIKFIQFDIIKDPFPRSDLWICRDCLFHFSFTDIYKAFENFARSEIPLLLTTTHINSTNFPNVDIETGDYRLIDLFSDPFFLSINVKYRIKDWVEPDAPREMILLSKDQVAHALPKMNRVINKK